MAPYMPEKEVLADVEEPCGTSRFAGGDHRTTKSGLGVLSRYKTLAWVVCMIENGIEKGVDWNILGFDDWSAEQEHSTLQHFVTNFP